MRFSKLQALAVLIVSNLVLPCIASSEESGLRSQESNKTANSLIEFIWSEHNQTSTVPFQVTQLNYLEESSSQLTQDQISQSEAFELISSEATTGYGWELFPDGLLYHSYMAGEKEPRFASQWLWEKDRGLIWEAAVGGRWGVFRKGTFGPDGEGFQFDVEGAGLVRIDPEMESDLEAADFRAGFIGTWRKGNLRWKTGYYHLSSHVGDEFLENNPTYKRKNYVRDALLIGIRYDLTPELTVYGEYAYAANANGGAEPGEFQFGFEYSALTPVWLKGSPFAAMNAHLREEYNYGGSINILAGWQWIGPRSDHSFRFGFQHYNGPSMQYSFVNQYESLTGLGIWFDF